MPTRRRLRIVSRKVEPSGAELACGAALLLFFVAAAAALAGLFGTVLMEHLLLGCPSCWLR